MVINLLELYLNSVLYHRRIYPEGIFRKHRAFNTFTFATIFPPLQEYFENVLNAANEALRQNVLDGIDVVIYKDDQQVETHTINIGKCSILQTSITEVRFEVEEAIKTIILHLDNKLRAMEPLQEDCTFKLYLRTTQDTLQKLNSDCRFTVRIVIYNFISVFDYVLYSQDFPWILDSTSQEEQKGLCIDPIVNRRDIGISLLVRKHLE